MQIVNNGVPDEIYELMCLDFYDGEAVKGSISATSLLKPVQEYVLMKRHSGEVKSNATDMMWSVFGSSIHAMLEKLPKRDGVIMEQRYYATVDGTRISGKIDRIVNSRIKDYKVTKAGTMAWGGREEWVPQMSIYRWLYWKTTGEVLDGIATIIPILRDWDERKVGTANYPKLPAMTHEIKLMPLSKTQSFIEEKVRAIKAAESLPDEKLPECSPKERWYNERREQFIKCEKYCSARSFCQQLKRYQEEK